MTEPEITWVQSPKIPAFRHGMVGGVRAFTLDVVSRPFELHCKLPGPLGSQLIERLPSEEAAYKRAHEKVIEFLQLFNQTSPPSSA
ncbi:hypothetical protein GCM10009677_08700 [Sphaerisporangium rubeum]|uniref:Uncharacterized protein n=1 Tax=Sphaerisporangium rubeum TaxID=321317 RepID=A0A7X0IMA5_9ACTN|nr:hypothetical protein [Sphaerisporangium rubeum]MBB6476623.1 hypothetical protein [Sphaerisporangium rubeum]